MRKALPVILAVFLVGCAANRLIVTGEVLDALGQQFLTTGQNYDRAYDQGQISAEDYKQWAEFAAYFQTAYPAAINAWELAVTNKDESAMQNVKVMVESLRRNLLAYTLRVST